MKIVVCVKHSPDAQADRRFTAELTTDREGVDGLLSELDEYAIEEALRISENADDVTITALTMGPLQAGVAVLTALQMGVHEGVHVMDDALAGSDALATSLVLAEALRKLEPDLVLTGMTSTDGSMGVVPAMLAERLGLPQVTFASSLTVEGTGTGSTVRIERDSDVSTEVIEAALPAVVSVTDQINEPRSRSLRGILAAKKKKVPVWSLADLGLNPQDVGASASRTLVQSVTARPPRAAGQVITDEGDGGSQLVAFLAGAKLV